MWSMALHAAVDITYNTVLVCGIFSNFLDVLMTQIAQEGRKVLDHLGICCSVRIVAADAVVFYGFVYKIKFLQLIFHNLVTGKTKIRLLGHQQVRLVGTVRLMTYSTFPDGCRPMQKRKPLCNLMAGCTKSSDGFFRNQKFVIAAVRVMTLHTITRFQRFVNDLFG